MKKNFAFSFEFVDKPKISKNNQIEKSMPGTSYFNKID